MRTSNPGAGDIQELMLSDGRRVWQHVAGLVSEWGAALVGERGLSSVGAVVGATVPRAVAEARPPPPAVGAAAAGRGRTGRSTAGRPRPRLYEWAGERPRLRLALRIGAYPGADDWRTAAAGEAARLRAEVWSVSGW